MKEETKTLLIPDFFIMLKGLKELGNCTMTELYQKTNITYAYLHKLKNIFLEKNWITGKKDGVKLILNLTPEGHEITLGIYYLFEKMNITDENIQEYRIKRKQKKIDKNV